MRTPAEGRSTLTDPVRPGSRMWREGRGGRLRLSVEWPQDSDGVNLMPCGTVVRLARRNCCPAPGRPITRCDVRKGTPQPGRARALPARRPGGVDGRCLLAGGRGPG